MFTTVGYANLASRLSDVVFWAQFLVWFHRF